MIGWPKHPHTHTHPGNVASSSSKGTTKKGEGAAAGLFLYI